MKSSPLCSNVQPLMLSPSLFHVKGPRDKTLSQRPSCCRRARLLLCRRPFPCSFGPTVSTSSHPSTFPELSPWASLADALHVLDGLPMKSADGKRVRKDSKRASVASVSLVSFEQPAKSTSNISSTEAYILKVAGHTKSSPDLASIILQKYIPCGPSAGSQPHRSCPPFKARTRIRSSSP